MADTSDQAKVEERQCRVCGEKLVPLKLESPVRVSVRELCSGPGLGIKDPGTVSVGEGKLFRCSGSDCGLLYCFGEPEGENSGEDRFVDVD